MKKYIGILILSLMLNQAFAQTNGALAPGAFLPPIAPLSLYNIGGTIDLNKKDGKLIIIDFFTAGCPPCIAAIPKMEALQLQFKDRLQIVMVTSDQKDRIETLKLHSATFANTTLPMVIGDTILKKTFKYYAVPTHAWIDENKTFRYITNGSTSDPATLRQYFDGQDLKLKTNQSNYQGSKPLFTQVENLKLNAKYTSIITGEVIGPGGSVGSISDSATKHIVGYKFMNVTPVQVFRFVMEGKTIKLFPENRTILEVKHPEKYLSSENPDEDWIAQNRHCYEITVPDTARRNLVSYVQQDLKRAFGLTASVKKRKMKVLVLKLKDSTKLRTLGARRSFTFNRDLLSDYVLRSVAFSQFFGYTIGNEARKYAAPVIDETAYKQKIDITINGPIEDLTNVKAQLLTYGLELKETTRKIEMLVIKDH